jgi:hypothetical protein
MNEKRTDTDCVILYESVSVLHKIEDKYVVAVCLPLISVSFHFMCVPVLPMMLVLTLVPLMREIRWLLNCQGVQRHWCPGLFLFH